MAGTKISALAALTAVADGDLLPIVDVSDPGSGTTKNVTAADVAAYVVAGTGLVSSDLYQGVPFYAYGYSWMEGTGAARAKWLDRVVALLSTGTMTNHAETGDTSIGVWQQMAATGAKKWPTNTTGVVLVECALNDLRYIGNDAASIAMFKRTVGGMVHLLRAASLTEQSAASFSASWTPTAHATATASLMTFANAIGQTADITFTGTEVTIHTFDLAPNIAAGGSFTVKEGATLLATHSCNGVATQPPHYEFAFPDYVHISGLAAGAHTLRIEQSVAGTIYLDGWTVPMAAPPTVVLVAAPYLADYTAAGAPWADGSDAAVDAYRTALEQVAALFPIDEVIVVNPNIGWDKNTMLNADTVHPNDIGAAHIAAAVSAALHTLDYRAGVQLL